jgi:hypothetical protein
MTLWIAGGRVRASEHHDPPPRPEGVRHPIDVAGVWRVARDADQIHGGVEVDPLRVLVNERHGVRQADKRRQMRHRELGEVVELPTSECPDEGILWRDGQNPHRLAPHGALARLSAEPSPGLMLSHAGGSSTFPRASNDERAAALSRPSRSRLACWLTGITNGWRPGKGHGYRG